MFTTTLRAGDFTARVKSAKMGDCMRKVRLFLRRVYQPFRFAVVKPIENSGLYKRIKENIMDPLRIFFAAGAGRLLIRLGLVKTCVVVCVDGGLGNQMMQYSLGRKVEKSCDLPVYYDVAWFSRDGMDINHRLNRNFEIETAFPGIKLKKAGFFTSGVYRIGFKVRGEIVEEQEDFVLSSRCPRYLGWGCVRFRDDEMVRDEFVFGVRLSEDNKAVLAEIENASCSVAVHVRRGDYIGSIHEMTSPAYFMEAIKLVSENAAPERATFFVFSDDMGWCKDNLGGLNERVIFVENNDNDHGSVDMYLMSRCRSFILSNSTFSYWASFLSDRSPDSLVITPCRDSSGVTRNGERLSGHVSVPV